MDEKAIKRFAMREARELGIKEGMKEGKKEGIKKRNTEYDKNIEKEGSHENSIQKMGKTRIRSESFLYRQSRRNERKMEKVFWK